ncbi:hypothetical protein [Salipaludibacillus keqinensis]|nr:hypothetical protein [Salipaludibacillus keqinensis]
MNKLRAISSVTSQASMNLLRVVSTHGSSLKKLEEEETGKTSKEKHRP